MVLTGLEALSRIVPHMPSPLMIGRLVAANMTDAAFLFAVASSLRRMMIGFTGVVIIGIGMGLLLGRFRFIDDLLGTVAVALHAMPGAAWVPLAIVLFGLNESAVIFTVLLGAAGIVMVNTSSGVKEVPPLVLRAAKTMGARGATLFWNVIVPAAIPRIVDGLRLAWAFGWRALMAGELMVGSIQGMGRLLNDVAKQRQMPQLLAFMVIIAAISVAIDALVFKRMEKMVKSKWGTA